MLKRLKNRSPLQFAIYVVVTIFGGVVLVLFLILMGLLYWMNAPVYLPKPGQFIPPDTVAGVVFRAEPVEANADRAGLLNHDLPAFLTHGAPAQVRNLIRKGVRNSNCRVQGVACWVPAKDGIEPILVVSLSRGPGQFRLVRRDLERRVRKNLLAATLTYHDDKAVFVFAGKNPFNALSLADCTVIRTTDADTLATVLDLSKTKKDSDSEALIKSLNVGKEPILLSVAGWMDGWHPEVFAALPDTSTCRALQRLAKKLDAEIPALSKLQRLEFTTLVGLDMTADLYVVLTGEQDIMTQAVADTLVKSLRQDDTALGIVSISAKATPDKQHIDLHIQIKPKEKKHVPADAGDGP